MKDHMLVLVALAGLGFTASSACAQDPPRPPPVQQPAVVRHLEATAGDSADVHQFVQGFYDWYTATREPLGKLLTDRTYLDPSLATALRGDSAASRDRVLFREIINFDPFLDSQDPCPRYEVTEVRPQQRNYRVTVRPVCPGPDGQRWQTNRPVVEVIQASGRWRIANVWYGWPDSTKHDLVSLLCAMAKGDSRPEKRPAHCSGLSDCVSAQPWRRSGSVMASHDRPSKS